MFFGLNSLAYPVQLEATKSRYGEKEECNLIN